MTLDDELNLLLQWSNEGNLNTAYGKRIAETLRLLGIRKFVVSIGTFNFVVLFS